MTECFVGESGEVGRRSRSSRRARTARSGRSPCPCRAATPRARASPSRTGPPRDRARRSAAPRATIDASATTTSHVAKRAASVAAEIVRTSRGVGIADTSPSARPSRSPRLEITMCSAPRCRITARTTRAPPTIVSARSGLSPRSRARRFIVRRGEVLDDVLEVALAELVSVQQRQRMVGATQVDLGEVAHRASDPDQIPAGIERGRRPLPRGFPWPIGAGPSSRAPRRVRHEEPVAHAEGPEGERPGSLELPVMEARQLHAPAADVDRDAVDDRQVVDRAEETERRLTSPVDDLEGHPQRTRASASRRSPSLASRTADGRHRDHALRSRTVRDRPEVPERLEGPIDRFRTEAVVVTQLPTEAERGAGVLEHIEMLTRAEPEHDHPRRVRTRHPRRRTARSSLSRPPTRFHGLMLPHGAERSETLGRPLPVGALVCS